MIRKGLLLEAACRHHPPPGRIRAGI